MVSVSAAAVVGDLTAEEVLKAGRADALRAYLRRVAEGGYA